jgi:hypothetical protein
LPSAPAAAPPSDGLSWGERTARQLGSRFSNAMAQPQGDISARAMDYFEHADRVQALRSSVGLEVP